MTYTWYISISQIEPISTLCSASQLMVNIVHQITASNQTARGICRRGYQPSVRSKKKNTKPKTITLNLSMLSACSHDWLPYKHRFSKKVSIPWPHAGLCGQTPGSYQKRRKRVRIWAHRTHRPIHIPASVHWHHDRNPLHMHPQGILWLW